MKNVGRITFLIVSYTLSAVQSNFILMMLLINQWYLESQKPHIILAKKIKEMFLIKNKSQRSC